MASSSKNHLGNQSKPPPPPPPPPLQIKRFGVISLHVARRQDSFNRISACDMHAIAKTREELHHRNHPHPLILLCHDLFSRFRKEWISCISSSSSSSSIQVVVSHSPSLSRPTPLYNLFISSAPTTDLKSDLSLLSFSQGTCVPYYPLSDGSISVCRKMKGPFNSLQFTPVVSASIGSGQQQQKQEKEEMTERQLATTEQNEFQVTFWQIVILSWEERATSNEWYYLIPRLNFRVNFSLSCLDYEIKWKEKKIYYSESIPLACSKGGLTDDLALNESLPELAVLEQGLLTIRFIGRGDSSARNDKHSSNRCLLPHLEETSFSILSPSPQANGFCISYTLISGFLNGDQKDERQRKFSIWCITLYEKNIRQNGSDRKKWFWSWWWSEMSQEETVSESMIFECVFDVHSNRVIIILTSGSSLLSLNDSQRRKE